MPLLAGQALISPAAAQRRVRRLADEVRARDVPPGGDIPTRVDGVVELLFRTMPLAPRSLPGAAVGFAMLGLAGRAAARLDASPAICRPCCAARPTT